MQMPFITLAFFAPTYKAVPIDSLSLELETMCIVDTTFARTIVVGVTK